MSARVWYVAVTLTLLVIASAVARYIHNQIVQHQRARLAGWDELTTEERVERLRVMKDVQIVDGARRWANGFVAVVMFAWFVPSSLFWIANVAEDTKHLGVSEDLANCRLRNDGERANRRGALADIGAISRFLLRQGVEQETVDQLAEDRLSAIPDVEDTDRDCDGSGVIGDEGDYPLVDG